LPNTQLWRDKLIKIEKNWSNKQVKAKCNSTILIYFNSLYVVQLAKNESGKGGKKTN